MVSPIAVVVKFRMQVDVIGVLRCSGVVVFVVREAMIPRCMPESLNDGSDDHLCVPFLVITIILVSLHGRTAHVATVARLVRELSSDREDFVLHARDT